ncbi:MAG: hypothetical protein C4520_02045 [Candidatus Abyssobacteria bacterium SURF_5]|uniref:Amine oxidase domain-containing protein n=1 Tax=Abyssobacteria bacterium (strain SURF_5) TaxID=2093360 RepID=A0A3A4NYX1_ABYX5|nr:MAG: hypothetical protein C4520_02045 [Candidatus Abyssubacteria bacterium SURF_5]
MASGKVIIIGAGIGGLAAGYWLCQRGYEVKILEGSDRPGGRMVFLERKGDRVDVGAQFYHSNYRYAFELADAANLSHSWRPIKGKTQFSLRDGSTQLFGHRDPWMKMLGVRGNLQLYCFLIKYFLLGKRFPMYRIARDIPEYDNVMPLDLYPNRKDQPIRDYIVTVVSQGENTGMPEWINLYHYLHQFRMTMLTDFLSLTRGVSSLTEELARQLPVQYESPVRQLVAEKGRIVGVQMEKQGTIKKAGHVIVAVAPPSASRLMPEELEEQKEFFDSIVYAPLPMPVFYLDRPLRKDVWNYFNDPGLKKTFWFAIDAWAKVPEMVPSGKSILTGWSGHPLSLNLIDQPDDEILKKAQEDIEVMVPGFSKWVEEATVFRHPYATARYPVGSHRRILDFKKKAEQLKGVSFVSDVFGGSAMEGAMASAAEAVSRVCQWGGTA